MGRPLLYPALPSTPNLRRASVLPGWPLFGPAEHLPAGNGRYQAPRSITEGRSAGEQWHRTRNTQTAGAAGSGVPPPPGRRAVARGPEGRGPPGGGAGGGSGAGPAALPGEAARGQRVWGSDPGQHTQEARHQVPGDGEGDGRVGGPGKDRLRVGLCCGQPEADGAGEGLHPRVRTRRPPGGAPAARAAGDAGGAAWLVDGDRAEEPCPQHSPDRATATVAWPEGKGCKTRGSR